MKRSKERYPLTPFLAVALFYGSLLFGLAKTLAWWNAWAFLALFALVSVLTADVFKRDPGMVRERWKAGRSAPGWDKALVALIAYILPLAVLVLAGLDKRLGWTRPWPLPVALAALGLAVLGSVLTYWAMKANPFFSSYVRIQKDRGQRVVTGGPYAYVRHPGYAGSLLYNLSIPVLLGSLPAVCAGLLTVGLLLARTALEDRTLEVKLKGYQAYAAKVRFRLLPFLW